MRTNRILAATATAVALLTAACSNGGSSDDGGAHRAGSVDISFESYMPTLGQSATATLNGLVKDFETANPTIHVTTIPDANSSTSALSAAYQRKAATNSLPDVGQVIFDTLRFAVQRLQAQNLDAMVGADAVRAELGGAYPYAPAVSKLAVVDGHTFGVPWTLSTPVLFYNPTLLRRAGLDPARPPATWADVADAAAQIKAKTNATPINVGCVGTGATGSDWCLQAILSSAGGSVVDSSGDRTTFDKPANVTAVRTLQKLAKNGSMVDLTIAQAVQEFATGKLAMILNTSALQGSLLSAAGSSFDVKGGPLPGFGDRPATPTNSGSTLMVFTKDKAKQQAAWKLIQFLTNPRSETTITTKVGYPPLRPALVAQPRYLKPFATQHPLLGVNVAQFDRLVPWQSYPGPNFLQIETLLSDAVTKAIFQGADPATTLGKAQGQANGLVSR